MFAPSLAVAACPRPEPAPVSSPPRNGKAGNAVGCGSRILPGDGHGSPCGALPSAGASTQIRGAFPRRAGAGMLKHRGFPGRLAGTDHQFVIRRAKPGAATPIVRRERHADRRPSDREADRAFLAALLAHFGDEPFLRGNLDAGRLSWLFGREVVPADPTFDPASYDAILRIDLQRARLSFPELFEGGSA